MAEFRDHGSVQSLLRALDLLEVLAEEPHGLRLVMIAEKSGLPTSTVHRLLTTLEDRQFVSCDRDTREWSIGGHCFAVAAGFGRRRNLGATAQPVMQRLHERCELSVNLAIVELTNMMLISQVPGRHAPPGLARVGARSPITATALGQSVIAALPEIEIGRILDSASGQLSTPKDLPRSINEIRQKHFAVDNEGNVQGLRCVGAAIHDEYGNPIAALSLVGNLKQVKIGALAAIGSQVQMAAAEVTRNIGGHTPQLDAH
jgi:IclR family acetate operon transcriptional repressor